ncbi:MAG: hypothetical protein WC091_11175 [Sulfuricellaceae bacterium]
MSKEIDYRKIRQALATLSPAPAHQADTPPEIKDIFAPRGHEGALDPERILVVGGRGVGKSFWSGALLNDNTRDFVSKFYPRLGLDSCRVALGYSGTDLIENGPPSQEMLDDLVEKDGFKPEIIWRAVVLHCLRAYIDIELPAKWRGKSGLVAWAEEDAERLQGTLRAADQRLVKDGLRLIIVFDALDRLGDNWVQIRERSKGLMRVALAFRAYKAIKLKIFMRVDQAEDKFLVNFPDASKLIGAKVDLTWERKDLFGLLFSLLVNHTSAGIPFQQLIDACLGKKPDAEKRNGLPFELMESEQKQIDVFTMMAGQYMGSDPRRGKTYTWVHNHLADAFGLVSPRSFLEAFRAAAERGDQVINKVLDPKGLQYGLQVASELRVTQLREEYGWIGAALEPLADLRVPCEERALFERWQEKNTIIEIERSAKKEGFLEPVEFTSDGGDLLRSLLDAMRRIGVAELRTDGRVNMPDIYRVAAKLLRMGGVKPRR